MIWFAVGLFVAALLAWGVPTLLARRSGQAPPPWVGVVVAVVAVALAGASVCAGVPGRRGRVEGGLDRQLLPRRRSPRKARVRRRAERHGSLVLIKPF